MTKILEFHQDLWTVSQTVTSKKKMEKYNIKKALRTFVRRESFELTENLCEVFGVPKHSRMYKVKRCLTKNYTGR